MSVLIDVAGAALILANAAMGWRYGLLRRFIALAGLFGAVGVASFAGNATARLFYGSGKPQDLYADAWAFIALGMVVVAAVEILGVLYHDRLQGMASLVFDRTGGVLVGLVLGFLEISVVCVVGLAVGEARSDDLRPLPADRTTVSSSVRESVVGGRVNAIDTGITNLFKPVLPDDLPRHLAESAQVETKNK